MPALAKREVDLVTATRDLVRVEISEIFPVHRTQLARDTYHMVEGLDTRY